MNSDHYEMVTVEVVVMVVVVVVVVVTLGPVSLVLTELYQIPVNKCKAVCGVIHFQTQNAR
jgi:hypothetical protein